MTDVSEKYDRVMAILSKMEQESVSSSALVLKLYDFTRRLPDATKDSLKRKYGTGDLIELYLMHKGAIKKVDCPRCETPFAITLEAFKPVEDQIQCESCGITLGEISVTAGKLD